MIDTAKIAKNTVYLYIRMILVLGAQFYAVRILLEALGVEDYGLFNLIVGFVTLFTLLNGAMMSTVQRFLCYEMGKKDGGDTRSVFSGCFILFAILAILIVVLSETIGLWFVNHQLNIPADRFSSAAVVYQLSILVMVFKTIQIPYSSLIVSHERMSAFAQISLVEAGMTFFSAFALKFFAGDLLIVYASLYTSAIGIVLATYVAYCYRNFMEAKLRLVLDKTLYSSLGAFFSWSVFGAVANILKQQGLNVLINVFFGVAYNATWAVANKLGLAVNQLVYNFQQAFQPQIIKTWSNGDKVGFAKLLTATSKFSFFLMLVCMMPLLCYTDFFLGVWLKGDIPPQLTIFVQLSAVLAMIEAMAAPFWIGIQATGKIALYQVVISSLIASVFFISWICYSLGLPVWCSMIVNIISCFICHVYRILHMGVKWDFPVGYYLVNAMTPIFIVTFVTLVLVFLHPLVACMLSPLAVICFGFSNEERAFAKNLIYRKLCSK